MKKSILVFAILITAVLFACNKSDISQISLTASTTEATVGQTVSVVLTANANASNWTVTPSSSVTQLYGLTTSKINYFTFSQTGTYIISVKARNVAYDSTLHQSLDSCWKNGGGTRGRCTEGIDTASLTISVVK